MVVRTKCAIALLSLSFLSACATFDPPTFAGTRPDRIAALTCDRMPENSGQASKQSPSGNYCRPLTKVDIDQWMKDLSNWGRWGVNDQLGAVHLIIPAKRIEAAALIKKGLSISLAHDDSPEQSVDNNPPFGHKMLTTGSDPSAKFAFDQYKVRI